MISFITSVFKGENFLKRFLDNMTEVNKIEDCEIILVVNHSDTFNKDLEIINNYENLLTLNVITCDQESIYDSWNRGIKESSFNLVANANLDDVLYPEYIDIMMPLIEKYNKVSMFCGWDNIITNEEDLYRNSNFIRNKYKDTYQRIFLESKVGVIKHKDSIVRCYFGCHPVWRKSLHEKYGYFDSSFGSAGDYEFWLRCQHEGELGFVTNKLVGAYYLNPVGLSSSEKALSESALQDKKIRQKYEN